MDLLGRPVGIDVHHDGSDLHLGDPDPSLGDTVTAFVRVQRDRHVRELVVVCEPS